MDLQLPSDNEGNVIDPDKAEFVMGVDYGASERGAKAKGGGKGGG